MQRILIEVFYLADREFDDDPAFRKFKRQLYHSSISAILESLRPGMTTPVVRRCPDGHYRRVVYDIGPFIADYPEQVMLAGVVQGWCARYVILLLYPQYWHAYGGHSTHPPFVQVYI